MPHAETRCADAYRPRRRPRAVAITEPRAGAPVAGVSGGRLRSSPPIILHRAAPPVVCHHTSVSAYSPRVMLTRIFAGLRVAVLAYLAADGQASDHRGEAGDAIAAGFARHTDRFSSSPPAPLDSTARSFPGVRLLIDLRRPQRAHREFLLALPAYGGPRWLPRPANGRASRRSVPAEVWLPLFRPVRCPCRPCSVCEVIPVASSRRRAGALFFYIPPET